MKKYPNKIDKIFSRLSTDFEKYNGRPLDRWEHDYYKNALIDALYNGNCWTHNGSIIAIKDNSIFYTAWQGNWEIAFKFLIEILSKYINITVTPFGSHLHDLLFIMNARSVSKFQKGMAASIRLESARFDFVKVLGYLNGWSN